MRFSELDPQKKHAILGVWRDLTEHEKRAIADKHFTKVASIDRYERRYRQEQRGDSLKFPESPTAWDEKPLLIKANNAMLIGDIEVPDHNARMLEISRRFAIENDLPICILAGDFMSVDHFKHSKYPSRRQPISFDHALELAEEILDVLLETYDHVYYFMGNHDDRVEIVTDGHLTMRNLIRKREGLTVNDYHYMHVILDDGVPVEISHPKEYRKQAVSVVQDLYNTAQGPWHPRRQVKPHQVAFHNHWGLKTRSIDDWRDLVLVGCMRLHAAYKDKQRTTHRQWVSGFATIENGKLRVYNETDYDWDDLLDDSSDDIDGLRDDEPTSAHLIGEWFPKTSNTILFPNDSWNISDSNQSQGNSHP